MPDRVKEKLVELLKRTDREVYEALKDREDYREEMLWDYFASNLIANGVTFANDNNVGDKLTPTADKLSATEWISVKDRLPTEEDASVNGSVYAYTKAKKVQILRYEYVCQFAKYMHCWMPISLPQPPKGE